MKAIEFQARSKNGMIRIPKKYKEFSNAPLKIIILSEEDFGNETRKMKIKNLVTEIISKNVFEAINDPSKWQKELRNEWK